MKRRRSNGQSSKGNDDDGRRAKRRKTTRTMPASATPSVRVITAAKLMTDEAIMEKEGHFLTDEDFPIHIGDEDVDCYKEDGTLLFKFRKRVIPPELCALAVPCFKKAAKHKHYNRGPSSGLVSLDRMPSYVKQLVNPTRYRSKYISTSGKLVNWDTGNMSHSNIIGYFDAPNNFRSKERHDATVKKYPCRTTAFTRDHRDLWEKSLPLINHVDTLFKQHVPERYAVQRARGQRTPFIIADTAFSTITINYNWQTAVHVDAGDLREGFGNFAVFEEGEYSGGKLGFPQYGVCVDVRMGDYMAMDVHSYHCNTPLVAPVDTETGKEKDYTRLSMVFYLREKMARCEGATLDT